MKVCSRCKLTKQPVEFRFRKKPKPNLMSWCKLCERKYKIEHYSKNKERIDKEKHEYYLKNKERASERAKKSYATNYLRRRKEMNEYHKLKMQTDPAYKMRHRLRSRIYNVLKGKSPGSFSKSLGCNAEQLKSYLESKFQPGMAWENHGTWHIDHIIPLASFDLTNPEQFERACHYTNLQPLWAAENLRKSDKL